MGDDYRAQTYVSPVERKFDEFAGFVFHTLRCGTVVQDYEAVGVFCEFDDLSHCVFHFVVIARYREHIGILQVLPVLVGFVVFERWAYDEDVFKMVFVFFL